MKFSNSKGRPTQLNIKPSYNTKISSLSGLREVNPLPSKKFRVEEVMKKLTHIFVQSCEDGKSSSTKSSFYNVIKQDSAREPYLDCSKGFSQRYYTAQLRISAHDLHILKGGVTQIHHGMKGFVIGVTQAWE